MKSPHLAGLSALGVEGLLALTDVVESMHGTIASVPWLFGGGVQTRTRGITGLVYRSIRGTTRLMGWGVQTALALQPDGPAPVGAYDREAFVSALNGVVGDHLVATSNPLAIPMELRLREGTPRTGKILLLVHGLCMSDTGWLRNGHDHGAALAKDLGYTPVYVRYNSGRHVSENGRELAACLARLVRDWPVPVEELAIVAHSMGGLVVRSAWHEARGAAWTQLPSKLVFLGTPHHGSHLERGGIWLHFLLELSPYSGPLARLGKLRSAGITDLRHGNVREEDWRDRDRFTLGKDERTPLPLPSTPNVKTYALAAAFSDQFGAGELAGDGMVPLSSALGQHPDPSHTLHFTRTRTWIGRDCSHFELLNHPEVYAQLREWLSATTAAAARPAGP